MRHERVLKSGSFTGLAVALVLSFGMLPMGHAVDNLKFRGNLVEQACTLRPGDESVTLELWDLTSKYLYSNTRSLGKGFKLHLDECDTTIGNTVTIIFGGTENGELPGLFSLDGGSSASGIGLGLETLDSKPLPVNRVSDEQVLSNGGNVIELKAYVQGEPSALRERTIGHGAYTVTTTFTLDYP